MNQSTQKPRAIDLYSGVGGWSFGLALAGIDVVASYERWGAANETNFKNNRHQAHTVDIRRLALDDLPTDIDIVVGSPPCTQFSYSNRGGNGNIEDGLTDIIKFLEIVEYLKPKSWAMENVPRVVKVMEQESGSGGRLERFTHLGIQSIIVNMEEFGIPQRRRRCIVGNFDSALLMSYRSRCEPVTLGTVVRALAECKVIDPLYGHEIDVDGVSDHKIENFLNPEEERINRANKIFHPIYNRMPFPDPLDRSVRTITATCTRVSRESIVIEDLNESGRFRRLSVRERACLQGFPVGYQFYAASVGQKHRMIGNALPPIMAYFIANSMLQTEPRLVKPIKTAGKNWSPPTPLADTTKTDRPGAIFRANRSFRFSIPSLRLASGVRFEFHNDVSAEYTRWRVRFIFGTSKSIQSIELNDTLYQKIYDILQPTVRMLVQPLLHRLEDYISAADIGRMQAVWSHRSPGGTRPFMLLDELDWIGQQISTLFSNHQSMTQHIVEQALMHQYDDITLQTVPGQAKLKKNSSKILAGILLGCRSNAILKKSDLLEKRDIVAGV